MRASELLRVVARLMMEMDGDPEVATYHHDDSTFYPPLIREKEGRIEIVCNLNSKPLAIEDRE